MHWWISGRRKGRGGLFHQAERQVKNIQQRGNIFLQKNLHPISLAGIPGQFWAAEGEVEAGYG